MMNVFTGQTANSPVVKTPSRKQRKPRGEQTPDIIPTTRAKLDPKWQDWFKALGGEWTPAN